MVFCEEISYDNCLNRKNLIEDELRRNENIDILKTNFGYNVAIESILFLFLPKLRNIFFFYFYRGNKFYQSSDEY